MLKIPSKIQYVLNALHKNGYEAYIVGGCVRDALLGIAPHDYDVTTSATPDEVTDIFECTIPTGIKHGTVTVIIEKEPIEVTTFRTEGSYSDSRRPDSVKFVTNLYEDLSRRDFTVNAFAFNECDGLVDHFGGKEDLKNKILKAVGDSELRFSEDALRILRLFRFASQLDFKIEENTFNSALKLSDTLEKISRERIFTELLKTVNGKNPQSIFPLLENGGLAFLGIKKPMDFSVFDNLPPNENLRLCVFLKETCENPLKTLKELKCSNLQYRYCENFLKLLSLPIPENKPDLKNALFLTVLSSVSDWLLYLKALKVDTENSQQLLKEILENQEPFLISHLKIDGKQLQKLGFSGKEVGEKLEMLRKTVVENPKYNTYKKLISLIQGE